MDDGDRRITKRSRFDQTQPEPKKSRFDRRSRSPPSRKPDTTRDRSPLSRDGDRATPEAAKKPASDPAAAAGEALVWEWLEGVRVDDKSGLDANYRSAAAAARISASLQAKKGPQHVDVPPILSASSGDAAGSGGAILNTEIYMADGDYIKDIEINDLRNRYVVTRASTQHMVNILWRYSR